MLLVTNRLALGLVATYLRSRNLSYSESGIRGLLIDRALLLLSVIRGRLSDCTRRGS